MEKQKKFTLLSVDEFAGWLGETRFHRVIRLVQNHHTWLPHYESFTGSNHFALLDGMERAHIERGFAEIAQNLTTFPDGTLALCRSFEVIPAGIKGANREGLCIEHLGNFDAGSDVMSPAHRATALRTNALLCREFSLSPSDQTIVYHHWWDLDTGLRTDGAGNTKTCPGTAFFGGNTVAEANAHFIPLVAAELEALGVGTTRPGPPAARTAEVVASGLNVRDQPSTAGRVVKRLTRGIRLGIYETKGSWHRIHPREQHWVFGKYLRFEG